MKKLLLILVTCFAFATAAFAGQINLNTATQAELDTLKGVGPVKAKAIVDYRTKNGPFKSVDDLEKVPGFGKITVDKLRGDLTVSGAAAPARAETKAKAEARKEAAPAKAEEKAKPAKAEEKAKAEKEKAPAKAEEKAAKKGGAKKEDGKKGADKK
ncbi:MAG: ComEA family DNA-binding protein [Betaproteobacteria bacterium]